MRLDKFLQISRLVKKRELANALCDAGKVTLAGRKGKASTEVQTGDFLVLDFPHRTLTVEILQIPSRQVSRAQARECIRVVEILEKLHLQEKET